MMISNMKSYVLVLSLVVVIAHCDGCNPNISVIYEEDNKILSAKPKGSNTVVFMGDSITEIWNYPKSRAEYGYVNRGICSETTAQMHARFESDVITLQPLVMVFLGGTNDLGEIDGPVTIEETHGNITAMAEMAKKNDIKVILASLLPACGLWGEKRSSEKIRALNSWIKQYAEDNSFTYLDYYSSFFFSDNGMFKSYLITDCLHPNDQGFAVMQPLVEDALEKTIGYRIGEESKKISVGWWVGIGLFIALAIALILITIYFVRRRIIRKRLLLEGKSQNVKVTNVHDSKSIPESIGVSEGVKLNILAHKPEMKGIPEPKSETEAISPPQAELMKNQAVPLVP